MYKYFKKVLKVLTPRQRFLFYSINAFLLFAAFLETISIIVILPAVQIITDGERIFEQYPQLLFLENYLPIKNMSVENLLVFFMLIIALIFILKNIILMIIYFFKEKFFFNVRKDLMEKIYTKYLNQSYEQRAKKNASLFINNIINEAPLVVDCAVKNYVNFFQEISVIVVLICFLIYFNPIVTLASFIFLLILFLFVYLPSKVVIKKYSFLRQSNEEKRIQDLNENFENFKYLKILSLEKFYLNFFSKQNYIINYSQYIVSFISLIPIKFFETFLIIGLFIVCYSLTANDYVIGEIITILFAYSLCGIRMLPSLNRLFVYLQSVKFSYPAIDKVYDDLIAETVEEKNLTEKILNIESLRLKIKKFGYIDNQHLFEDVELEIKKGDRIFLKGSTGSGKTTLINLITGLIVGQNTSKFLNDKLIGDQEKMYKKINFGYVPQDIFLSNTTLLNNIILNNNYEKNKFDKVISICDLEEFTNNLPDNINSMISEKSANISGGQRQRIAIARALMNSSEFLILDEATNALDSETEQKVIQNIINNYPRMIIIIISHKNILEKYCNKIYKISNKKVLYSNN
jgi:ATP-binding cassette, subfamily B, bacterial PglK